MKCTVFFVLPVVWGGEFSIVNLDGVDVDSRLGGGLTKMPVPSASSESIESPRHGNTSISVPKCLS